MNFVSNIEEKEYENFVKNHSKSHFLQSYNWGIFCKENKKMIPHYIGLKKNNKLICCALLLQKKLPFGYSYFYSPRGFIIDFNDKNTLTIFTEKLKEYLKKYNAIFLKIDPDIKLHDLDLEGNIISKSNNFDLIKTLINLGYKHLGFNKAFEHNQPRYTFRLNLTNMDEIKNNFHITTKKIISKGNPYELEILKNSESYIDDFYTTMEETAKRENIALYPKKYFLNFYKILHKNDNSDIYIVYLNKIKTLAILNNRLSELKMNIEQLKSESKKNELQNQIRKIEKLIEELENIEEDKLPLSSIITAKYGNKVWTMHGGNHTKLRSLNANYLIYYKIIEDAVKENYEMIDFFGTSYNPDEKDPEYGIHLFKKRLGGEYTEFIGEFDLVLKKFIYLLFNILIPIYRKISKLKNKK